MSKRNIILVFCLAILTLGTIFIIVTLRTTPPVSAVSYSTWIKKGLTKKNTFGTPKMSGNGRYLAVIEKEGVVSTGNLWLFDARTGQVLWTYKGKDKIFDVAISSDGKYVATAGSGVMLFDNSLNKPIWHMKSKGAVYDQVDISENGDYIAAANRKGDVYLLSKAGASPLKTWSVVNDFVLALDMSKDGKYIFTGSSKGVALLDASKNNLLWKVDTKFKNKSDKVTSVSISNDGGVMSAVTSQGVLYAFNKDGNNALWNYSTGSRIQLETEISGDGKYIALASSDKYWQFRSSSAKPLWEYNNKGRFANLDQSEDGKFIAVSDTRQYVYVFDRDFGSDGQRPIRMIEAKSPKEVTMSDDGFRIAYFDSEYNLQYKEIPVSALSKILDTLWVYRRGNEMRVRVFLSNPGPETRVSLNVKLGVPYLDFLKSNITGKLKKMAKGVVPKKIIDKVEEETGSLDENIIYGPETIVLEANSSKVVEFKARIPDLANQGTLEQILSGSYFIDLVINKAVDALSTVLPDVVASSMGDAARIGISGASGNKVLPTMGIGTVRVTDPQGEDMIDRDSFMFLFLAEGSGA